LISHHLGKRLNMGNTKMADDFNSGGGNADSGPVRALQGEARAQHNALLTNPEWQAAASGRGGHAAKEAALAKLEAIAKGASGAGGQQFTKPGVTSEQLKADPGYQADASGKSGTEAKANAANQLAEVERMEAIAGESLTDAEAAELTKAMIPNGPMDYASADGLGLEWGPEAAQARQILMDHKIPPQAVKELAPYVGKIQAMTDETYFASIDTAKATVMRWPGGRELIADAAQMLGSLPDGHPLARVGECAAATANGIKWLAWMYRRGKAA
jgi:hypothetical protein